MENFAKIFYDSEFRDENIRKIANLETNVKPEMSKSITTISNVENLKKNLRMIKKIKIQK